jgi:GNAT superfamily N-acetyltransferase
MGELVVKRVSEPREIEGIKALQEENRLANISGEEAEKEGFVTASYSMELLHTMHDFEPTVIACYENRVIGYAMVTVRELYGKHDLLDGLIDAINQMAYNHIPLRDAKVILVGQLCVAKPFRGRGVVPKMYHFFRECLEDQYDYCITDISHANVRSLKAHEKCGFKIINTLEYEGVNWHIVLWDWTE